MLPKTLQSPWHKRKKNSAVFIPAGHKESVGAWKAAVSNPSWTSKQQVKKLQRKMSEHKQRYSLLLIDTWAHFGSHEQLPLWGPPRELMTLWFNLTSNQSPPASSFRTHFWVSCAFNPGQNRLSLLSVFNSVYKIFISVQVISEQSKVLSPGCGRSGRRHFRYWWSSPQYCRSTSEAPRHH